MTQLTFAVTEDVIQRALDRQEPRFEVLRDDDALKAPGISALQAASEEAWGKLRSLVERCARSGVDFVRSEIEQFVEFVETSSRTLGSAAREFEDWVKQKIRELITSTFDMLLGALRSSVQIGGQTFVLDSVQLQQKLVYSGSLKASLNELCQFTGGGEFVLTGAYKAGTVA